MSHPDYDQECTIVMYHYVRDLPNTIYPNIKGRLTIDFVKQLEFIQKNYSIISLRQYLEFLTLGKKIPAKTCLLTFDDGLRDHYQNVFPILKRAGIKATFFIPTGTLLNKVVLPVHKLHFLLATMDSMDILNEYHQTIQKWYPQLYDKYVIFKDQPKSEQKNVWDDNIVNNLKYHLSMMPAEMKERILEPLFRKHLGPEESFNEELYLHWEELKEMVDDGQEIGNHTVNHPRLTTLSEKALFEEIHASKKVLEEGLNIKVLSISPPYGDFNDETINLIKKTGHHCSLTTDSGINISPGVDPFRLKRMDTNSIPRG